MGFVSGSQSMIGTLVPLFAVASGATPLWVGLLVALPNLLPIPLALPTGRWVDSGGAARAWLAGTTGLLAMAVVLAAAPNLIVLSIAQIGFGASQLVAVLGAQALVAERMGSRSLERGYASYATWLSVGRSLGPLMAGLAVDAFGFRGAFVAGALATSGAFAGAALATRRDTVRGAVDGAPAARAVAHAAGDRDDAAGEPFGVRTALRNVGMQMAIVSSAGVFIAISVRQAFLPVWLESLGYSATTIGSILTAGAVAAVVVRPFMPVVSRWCGGTARTLVVAMALVAVAVGVLGAVDSVWAFMLLGIVGGAGTGFGLPLTIVAVARNVHGRHRGAALGLRLSFNRAANLIAPVAVGAILDATGFGIGFAVAGAILAGLAALAGAWVPRYMREEASVLDAQASSRTPPPA